MHNRRLTVGALVLLLSVSYASGMGIAQESPSSPGVAMPESEAQLPVSRVMLFGSGVGFFQHQGRVDGNESVTLHFGEEEINDLLKSLFLSDLGGGTVSAVRYPSQDPISRVLSSYSIDLSSVQSIRSLLTQARGEPVRVLGDRELQGTVFGLEQRPDSEGINRDYLVLLAGGTIRSIALDEVDGVVFQNSALQRELESALMTIAGARQTDRKPVTFEFIGEGTRDVALAYVRETPVWKTSYRIVIGEEESTLQGWAIAENTTDQDWNDVRLSFIAGQPLSFFMNLYDPIYVERPVVEPSVGVAIAPPQYERAERELEQAMRSFLAESAAEDMAGGFAPTAAEPAPEPGGRGDAVTSRSQTRSLGGVFEYRIDEPVSIPRRQSAMIPIVDTPVELEAVSIYDESVLAAHPLRGMILTNTTGLHLMGGPVTIVESGTYAGDARFADIVEGETRQLSYAVDIDLTVDRESLSQPEQITRLRIVDGVLVSTRLSRRTNDYVVSSRGAEDRNLILEHPRSSDWNLVTPGQAWEQNSARYRFRLSVPAGETVRLPITEERISEQRFALLNMNNSQISSFYGQGALTDELRTALERLMELRGELATLTTERRELETRVNEIYRSQERVTRNMESLDRDSELYARYVADLTAQEDELAELEGRIEELRTREREKEEEINAFVRGLDIP